MRVVLLVAVIALSAAMHCAADLPAALARYPSLQDYFPYGFWFADGDLTVQSAGYLQEPYEARREKIFADLAKHYVNAIIPTARPATTAYLDVAAHYGLRSATQPLYLYQGVKSPHVPFNGEAGAQTMAWVRERWTAHAESIKSHPALLAYHVVDEPHPSVSPVIQQVTDLLAQVDPQHPAIYTHQSLPLDPDSSDWHRVEWKLLDSLDVYLSDHYCVTPPWGRDPWAYGDIAIANFRKVDPDALEWPIVQAFAYPTMPTIPELRVMVFHTVACGAKGMFFFTAGQAYVPWITGLWQTVGSAWFDEGSMYAEIGRIGAHLTSAGPLLIPRRLDPDYPAEVQTPSFRAPVRRWLRPDPELTKPAIHVGAFTGDDFDVLVVHNDDPWAEQGGQITITGRGTHVYDLLDLRPVPLAARRGQAVTFTVRFAPGDGRLYLVGDDRGFAQARQTVLRHRYDRERLLLSLDVEVAVRSAVAVAAAQESLLRAESLAGAGEFEGALAAVMRGRGRLSSAEAASTGYSRTRAALDATRKDFSAISDWLRVHPDFVTGGQADSYLVSLAERATESLRTFGALENELRAGHPNPEDAAALQAGVAALRNRIARFRPQGLQKYRIALLQPGDTGPDSLALRDWLQMIYRTVEILRPDASGRLVTGEGRVRSLESYDVAWIHLGDRSWPVEATYSGTARVRPDALSPAAVRAIQAYVTSGGGLVLSGLGAALLDDLGYERVAPNDAYWGVLAVPGGAEMAWNHAGPSAAALGLRPLHPEHPLFHDLDANGFAVWDWDPTEMVARAVWRKPSWPTGGTVLAGYWCEGSRAPDEFAAVVEYTRPGEGKVLALGDGVDPSRNREASVGARWGTNQDRLIRNVVEYCGRVQ